MAPWFTSAKSIETAVLLARDVFLNTRDVDPDKNDYVKCIGRYTPVGVLGFYWWLSKFIALLVANIGGFGTLRPALTPRWSYGAPQWGGFIQAVGVLSAGILDLVSSVQVSNSCSYATGDNASTKTMSDDSTRTNYDHTVRFFVNGVFILAGTVGIGSSFKIRFLVEMFTKVDFQKTFMLVALLLHVVIGTAFYIPMSGFGDVDRTMWWPVVAISTPLLIWVNIWIIADSIVTREHFARWAFRVFISLVMVTWTWVVGIELILIGHTADDIWGSTLVGTTLGKAFVVFIVLFPMLAFIGFPFQRPR